MQVEWVSMATSHLGRFLAVLDAFLCLFIFFPLSVFHWRGTWELQDIYFLPDRILDSSWISFALGANLCTLMLLFQPTLGKLINPERRVCYWVVSRIHLYIHGWAVMCYWRGLWNLMDLYLTDGWINSTVILVICNIIAVCTSTIRTTVGIPVSIGLDTDPDLLDPDTVYRINPEQTWKFIADVLFTQFVIISSNIAMWRGMWNIFDHFLFPENHLLSDLVSLAVGFVVIVLLFALQYPAAIISEKLDGHKFWKVFYEDALFMVMGWANLMLWRGGWDLCVHYVLPDGIMGPWLCHVVGTLGLTVFQVFNNVGLNGIERDGQYPRGEGIYPTKYLQVYLADYVQEREKGKEYQVVVEEGNDADISDLSDSDFSDSSTKPLYNKDIDKNANGFISENANGHVNESLLDNEVTMAMDVMEMNNINQLANGDVKNNEHENTIENGIS